MMEPQEDSASMSSVLVLSRNMCVNMLYLERAALGISACAYASAKQLLPRVFAAQERLPVFCSYCFSLCFIMQF